MGTELRTRLGDAVVPLGHAEIELTDAGSVNGALEQIGPTAVVNAAAYNLVDRAEDEPASAFAVNALGPRHLAQYCARVDIPLVHVSTDFVFGADRKRQTPYLETDAPGPQSAYAISKLAGEYFVQAHCRRHFVLRTCGLFGPTREPGRGNFVETMLRLATEKGELRVVNDQRCTPTATRDLATAIVRLLETDNFGLYHATNRGSTTWHEFATEIVRLAGLNILVRAISTAEFAAKAQRPAFSVLDGRKLARAIGWEFPEWRESLEAYLAARPRHGGRP